MKEKIKIYKLIDPLSNEVMYVGRTIHSISARMHGHYNDAKKSNTSKDIWIKMLLLKKLKPIAEIIEYVEPEHWPKREEYWILHYSKINPKLCNISNGPGLLGVKLSKEHLRLLSKAHSKPVYQLDLRFNIIKLHESCRKASFELKVSDTCISTAARNKGKKSAKGFIWVFLEQYEEWKKSIPSLPYSKDYSYLYHSVTQYDKAGNKIKEWNSLIEASEVLGIKTQGISKAKIGYRKTYKGFIWK